MSLQQKVTHDFKTQFGAKPEAIVRAPGRVNLIGEHTDYNDGFVLPMAIDRACWIALRRRDARVVLHSPDFAGPADFPLDSVGRAGDWTDYVRGMAWELQETGLQLRGWHGVLASDIPIASGLSSSAAIELAAARAFWAVSGWQWDGVKMAKAARRMENEFLGLQSGIMDQMISACGQKDHALLIDCRDLTTRPVPLPQGTAIVVMDTAVRRGLVDSAYNERVEQCRAAAMHLGVASLRDATLELLTARSVGLGEIPFRRAHHVITENERTVQAAAAMQAGEATTLGRLIDASHASLRDDYEVSSTELDIIVEIARSQEGCLGARMTGAGFGGCAIALVRDAGVASFTGRVHEGYQRATGLAPSIFACRPSVGAELVSQH